jgi:autotransporter-associated beta strand protein
MNPRRIINSISGPLRHLSLAAPMAAALWLGAGPSAQAIPPVTNGLVVWLSADSINTADTNQVRIVGADTFVKQWNDGSGNSKNATQTVPGDQPKYIASGLNGKPVLRFTQVDDNAGSQMELGDISASFPTAGSMFAVSTINADGRYNLFDNAPSDSRWVANNWSESQPGTFRSARQAMTYANWPQSGSHVFAMESTSGIYRFLKDNTVIGSTSAGSYNNGSGRSWIIGDRPGNGQQLNGDIPEFILYNRVLTTTEANMVGAYLENKYGLTSLTPYPPLPAPNVPTGVAATLLYSGALTVTWAGADGATSYNVSITDTVTSSEVVVNNVTPPYVASGLMNGRPYDFKVSSTNSTATSAYSSPSVTAIPAASTGKNILTFLVPGQQDGVISGANISVTVPVGTNVTALSPTYTVSNLASGSPVSGATRSFTTPQTYTITADDLSTQDYTVTVTEGTVASIFTWTTGSGGNWSDSAKWTNDLSNGLRPGASGSSTYTLNFNQAVTATNDLSASYVVNKLNFGSTVALAGNSFALTSNGAILPTINQNSGSAVTISAPLSLANNTTLGGSNTGTVNISGAITGAGSLTKSNGGTLNLSGSNSFTGGMVISAGTVNCSLLNTSPLGGAGNVNVTIQSGATLAMDRNQITGSLALNGGKVAVGNGWGDDQWNGPVALSGNSTVDVGNTDGSLAFNGVVSGTGTLTKLGTSAKAVPLNAANTFSGNIAISQGTIALGAAGSINSVALVSIAAGATFDVSAKSAYSFTSSNSLAAAGTGAVATTQAKLKGAPAGTVSLGSQPISLTYNGVNPALTVTQGALVLNANPFTVNTASPLSVGTHTIATQTTGSITSSGTYPGVTGTAIGAGKVGTISVSGSNVVLTISVPTLEVAGFPSSQTAGVADSVTVTAKDGAGNTATGYTGTVTFTSTDGAAMLPANYTFVAGDNGVHTFTGGVTLKTVAGGTTSITATQVGTPAVTGTQSGITVTPAPAATLTVSGFPVSKAAGSPDNVTVTAKDAFNNVDTGYTGTVAITSTDGAATLPADYTFVGTDNGKAVLSVTLNTVSGATVSITATDTVTGTITGTQSGIIVLPNTAPATLEVVGFPSPTTAGSAGSVTITAKTSGGATATTYTGTVHFTSNDGAATLPSDYTFVAGDNGVHTFTGGVTLSTAAGGPKFITATDTATFITGSQSDITVNPTSATTLVVSGYPNPQFVGTAGDVTVTAKDVYGNTDTVYTGTVAFTSTDGGATLPANYTFEGGDSGVHTFTGGVTFATAGAQGITATDTVTGTITGTQSGITVNVVPSIFNWVVAASNWDVATNWTNDAAITYVPDTAGQSNYVLNFNQAGTYTATNNLSNGFMMNRLNFGGATVTLAGLPIALTNDGAALPQINQNSAIGITVNNNVDMSANTTLGGSGNGAVTLNGVISGIGSLTKTTAGNLVINTSVNTYEGGTTISAGTVSLGGGRYTAPFGTGPVTITNAGVDLNGAMFANDMILSSATLTNGNGFSTDLSGAISLAGTTILDSGANGNNHISGPMSGSGGLTKIGTSPAPWRLSGINTYSGNTTVNAGSLTLDDNGGLRFVLTNGTSNKVTGAGTATLNGDFTIDTSAVAVSTGTWTLVDTTTKSFDATTFTVVGFTADPDGVTWTMTDSGKTWTFVETTGVLKLTSDGNGNDYDTWMASFPSITAPADKLPTADPDGDGLTNEEEYAFGLNPALGSSANPITVPLNKTTGTFSYTRRATPLTTGLTYTVQTSTDLATWPVNVTATQTVTGTVGDVETVQVTLGGTIPLTAPKFFVRVQAVPAP